VRREPQLVLASASPRRAELLRALGIEFVVEAAAIDERARVGELPDDLAVRLALAKATAVAHRRGDALPVLGADTVVVLDGRSLDKPVDRDDGIAMLMRLSAATHEVITAVAVARGARVECATSTSRVTFRAVDPDEASAYWETGEPRDKAGGYGIQGVGGIFVRHIEGSYSGIVGLPVAPTESLLRAFGVNTWRYRGG
jgi:septum formation protein